VQVIVGNRSTSALGIISQNRSILTVIVVAISGVVLLLVLVLGGRLRPGFLRDLRRRNKRSDPVTQPIQVNQEPISQPRSTWINRLQWPRRRIPSKSYAQLVPLIDATQEDSSPPIPITDENVTFGTDPGKVDQVLDDPSVDGLHAQLRRTSEGDFRLSDQGSTAGTWVNYSPVSSGGTQLEQGDLIHIGRVGFRFIMRNPKRVRKPVQKLEEPLP
jgi:pSer/pThr/pTyr-binding forkhead associated (FHA) protein